MTLTRLLSAAALLSALAMSPAFADAPPAPQNPNMMMQRQRMDDVLAQLPPDKAQIFRDTMKQVREKNRETYEKVHAAQDELKGILTADKFDKAAYLAKSAEIDKLYDQIRGTRRDAIVSVAGQFSASERKIIAQLREGPMMPPPAPDAGKAPEHDQPKK